MNANLDWLLAIGLVFSVQTQLRIGGLLGLGEGALALWIALTALRVLQRGRLPSTRRLRTMATFWTVFLVTQAIGAATAYAIDYPNDWTLVAHDVASYPFIIGVSCLALADPDAGFHVRRVCWMVALLGAVLLVAQCAQAFGLYSLPHVDPWFWERMRGWTDNPNQLALLCGALCLIALYLFDSARNGRERAIAALCGSTALGAGAMARTNSFWLMVVAGLAIFVVLRGYDLLQSARLRRSPYLATIWFGLLLSPVLLATLVTLIPAELQSRGIVAFARDESSEAKEEAELRFQLWREAIDRAVQSALLGLGPGPHLPIPNILLEARDSEPAPPSNVSRPQLVGAPNYESHNTFLEIFEQAGLVGMGAFLWIMASAFLASVNARQYALAASIVGLALFCTFHVTFRHPTVWFLIAACLAAEPAPAAVRVNRTQRLLLQAR